MLKGTIESVHSFYLTVHQIHTIERKHRQNHETHPYNADTYQVPKEVTFVAVRKHVVNVHLYKTNTILSFFRCHDWTQFHALSIVLS